MCKLKFANRYEGQNTIKQHQQSVDFSLFLVNKILDVRIGHHENVF